MSPRYLVVVLGFVVGLGCGSIKVPDGALTCAKTEPKCPVGFTCDPVKQRCMSNHSGPDGGNKDAPADKATPTDGGGGGEVSGDGGGVSCPALTAPTGGSVSASDLMVGGVAMYMCDMGSKLSGSAMRTCGADGTWSGDTPSCSATDCGPLTAPKDGQVSAPMTTFGSIATYSCGAGFGPSGSATRMCQQDGTWDGMTPTCVVANCPALAGPQHGSVVAPTLTFASVAMYACASGYTLAGIVSRTCKPDGTWSDAAPTCTIKDCGALTAPANGSVMAAAGTTYGATATFACDTGYTVSGAATVTCNPDGAWSAVAPMCAPKDCGALTAPMNGSVSATTTTFGSVATITCTTGYILGGAASRTCGADGKWTGAATTCTLADCGTLTAPANGFVSAPKTTYGQTATYSCMTGFGPSGSATRTCQANGTWDGVAPMCVIANCPGLSSPANGTVSAPMLTVNATATYACNTGYDLAGMATRTCQPAGTWSGTAPTCTVKDCGALTAPASGTVSAPVTTYGETATYACNTGYGATGALTRTCQANGMWDGAAPTCALKNCGALGGPTNGTVSAPTTTYGATATYACNTGYDVVGTATRTCSAAGTWSGTAPTCALKDCGGLTPPANGSVSAPTTTYGATATYSCAVGYGPSGSATRTCQANGTWSGTAPTCVIANCPSLQSPTGGSVSAPALTYGSMATYSCNAGYNINGATSRTCQANGTWSGAAPTCDPKDCGPLAAPTHGTVSAPTTTYTSIATYGCSSGYMLVGSSTRTCQSDQTWSSTAPTCPPVDCGNITVANGSVSYAPGTTFGSTATYTCNANYTLMGGGATVTCGANATWSGTRTCAKKNNGDPCSAGAQCGSGFCVGSVCCGTACNGTCDGNTCAGGTCEHASKQGTACGTRTLNQPMYNDIQLRCDAAGACKAPKIFCGATSSCDLGTSVCCMTSPPDAATLVVQCTSNQALCQCGPGGPCTPQGDQRWYGCKSNADCPNGQVCSAYFNFFNNYGVQYTACFVANTWPGGGNQFNNNFVCDPTKTGQCPGGQSCVTNTETGFCN